MRGEVNSISLRGGDYQPSFLRGDYFLYKRSRYDDVKFGPDLQDTFRRVKILVVDDEPMIRDLLKEMLESIGYEVHAVHSGKAALDYYGKHRGRVDVVVLDVMMPGMSGVEAFRKLKEIDPDVKAILASGYVERAQLDQAISDGIKDFIAKPFSLSELNRKLESVLA